MASLDLPPPGSGLGAPSPSAVDSQIAAAAAKAEADFLVLVVGIVRKALARGQAPDHIRRGVVAHFLQEPTLRNSDVYEQEWVVSGIQRAIEAGLSQGPAPRPRPRAATPPDSRELEVRRDA
jgi:hypothetical protein